MSGLFWPIQLFANWMVSDILHIDSTSKIADILNFFIFDTIKIFILLASIVFIVSLIRSLIPINSIKSFLLGKNKYLGHVYAALFGILVPFCSCSAVPLFMGFLEAGIPLGITISFLVASPMINEVALTMLLGSFGWFVAILYLISGLLIAIFSGIFIGKLKAEKLLEPLSEKTCKNCCSKKTSAPGLRARVVYSLYYTKQILGGMWLYVLIGVGLGAFVHGYIPTDFLALYAGADKWYAVPFVTLIGIPLYSNAAGVIPLISALTQKGMAMGTALALMMAVSALSFPEFIILRRVMKPKLIVMFATIVGVGIMCIGYLFNLIIG